MDVHVVLLEFIAVDSEPLGVALGYWSAIMADSFMDSA